MVDDYTEREREERLREREREREKCFLHYITVGPTTQREEVLYEKEKFF
jgi:2-keto-4-pentenoate hydratase/2-oxohepta-3-ene-1,7-dioic acid hydratase in catechol pathway